MANANDNLNSVEQNAEEFTDFENKKIDFSNCLFQALT